MIEARSQVFEYTGIPINEQLFISNKEWLTIHKVAIKRYKQKLKIKDIS